MGAGDPGDQDSLLSPDDSSIGMMLITVLRGLRCELLREHRVLVYQFFIGVAPHGRLVAPDPEDGRIPVDTYIHEVVDLAIRYGVHRELLRSTADYSLSDALADQDRTEAAHQAAVCRAKRAQSYCDQVDQLLSDRPSETQSLSDLDELHAHD
jgi:hypothetical protein